MASSWFPETGLSDPNISNPTALLENGGLSPRTFAYILSASNGECAALDTVLITVDPGPRALFTYSPREISSEDPVVYFNNESFGSPQNTFFWLFDSLGTSEARNPVFRFPDEVIDNYTVQLTVTDPNTGCADEYSAIIPVKPEMLVFVPNAFTPDGDGLNELWGPVMRNVDESDYRLTIYDRFGQIVFETRDVKQKWNGGMNGSDFYVQSGIYSWTINTKNKMTQDEIEFTGHVTVVR
jgi:gliding motility-associated-like protein